MNSLYLPSVSKQRTDAIAYGLTYILCIRQEMQTRIDKVIIQGVPESRTIVNNGSEQNDYKCNLQGLLPITMVVESVSSLDYFVYIVR